MVYHLKISRPRFWSYLAGPMLLGFVASVNTKLELLDGTFLLTLFFFLLPANIILYGVNDLADGDTDQYNPKKKAQEQLLKSSQKKWLIMSILCSLGYGAIAWFSFEFWLPRMLLLGWLLLSLSYSLPPFRFKARAGVDSLSNIMYIFPGLVGFSLYTNHLPPLNFVLAACLWAIAMHLYSAIPDIEADKKASLQTSAIVLGPQGSVLACGALWLASSLLLAMNSWWLALTGLVYLILTLKSYQHLAQIKHIYWWFPYVNTLLGFGYFLVLFLPKPYA